VAYTARQLDKDAEGNVVSRKPTGFKEELKTLIPGMRQDVPERKQPGASTKTMPRIRP
jgi:hypothetical protein